MYTNPKKAMGIQHSKNTAPAWPGSEFRQNHIWQDEQRLAVPDLCPGQKCHRVKYVLWDKTWNK